MRRQSAQPVSRLLPYQEPALTDVEVRYERVEGTEADRVSSRLGLRRLADARAYRSSQPHDVGLPLTLENAQNKYSNKVNGKTKDIAKSFDLFSPCFGTEAHSRKITLDHNNDTAVFKPLVKLSEAHEILYEVELDIGVDETVVHHCERQGFDLHEHRLLLSILELTGSFDYYFYHHYSHYYAHHCRLIRVYLHRQHNALLA
nr:hypothetical protein HmN_000983200 [Hymenolepis microstoma]